MQAAADGDMVTIDSL